MASTSQSPAAPRSDVALRLTPSVKAAVKRLHGDVTASAIAAELFVIHPEYGGGRTREVRLDHLSDDRAPPRRWLERVQELIVD